MKETIGAIHSAEVEDLFRSLGLSDALSEGRLHCNECGDPISKVNFRAVTRKEGNLLFSCNRENCYSAFVSRK